MKATKIYYEKLFNTGNFTNEKIGIELIIENGEKASDVLEQAKNFVNSINPIEIRKKEYEEALKIVNNKTNYIYQKVIDAEKVIENYKEEEDDNLPF